MRRILHNILSVTRCVGRSLSIVNYQLSIVALVLFCGCIENDIPYPHIEGFISRIEVEDMQGEPVISRANRMVEINVGEEVDLKRLQLTSLVVNDEATFIVDSLSCISFGQMPQFSFTSLKQLPANANTRVDATKPFHILIQTYQDYLWTVNVNQTIERYIDVEHQMGEAQFDAHTHEAIVYIEAGKNIRNVNITRMKLEGGKCTISPDPTTVHDFSRPRRFTVSRNGQVISTWLVDVQFSELVSQTGEVIARPRRATLKGSMKSGTTPVVEYRRQGEERWNTLSADKITKTSGVSFTAELTGLTDGTTYEWRIVVNGEAGTPASFQTEKIPTVPNLNFDTWTLSANGRNWYANPVADNLDDPQAYWASGNEGVTSTLAGNREATTHPVEGKDAYKGKAARMVSLTGVPLVGSAAGNLFIGTYKTNIQTPRESPQFGRAYANCHPDGLRGWYKYTSMPITNGTAPGNLTMDEGHIYMRIWDALGNEIAYGEHVITETINEWTPFEFRLKWTNLSAAPAKMTIVATSSHYGGDFEGAKVVGQVGDGSTIWVDEFEIIYD